MNGRNWYAVYTKPKTERKVTLLLSKKKMENFCPHNRVVSGIGIKKKMVYEPLFPDFVFVHVSENEMAEIRKTNDVLNFVYWLGKPAVIKTSEIENIAHFNSLYYNIKVEKIPVSFSGTVRITNHAEASNTTDAIQSSTTTVKLTLPSLGFSMEAETANAAKPAGYNEKNMEATV